MFTIRNESKKINARDRPGASTVNVYEKMHSSGQPAKLFDRKFVATTLRNTRCCPKCRSEYSTNYDLRMGDSHVKSNRPFLLNCGHNMCENCIYQNHQNLICSICQHPILIDKPNPPLTSLSCTVGQQQTQRHYAQQRQDNFNVRDFFYLNFFLIGELNHLRFYRRESSANNSLMISGQSPSSPSIGNNRTLVPGAQALPEAINVYCSECELQPAMGYCRQCTVHYCRICYDSIHMYGKALKRHSFVPLDNGRNANRYTKMPLPTICGKHKRVKDRYCRTCETVCCVLCAKTEHNGHRWNALVNENEKMKDEIENILESVKISRENLRKAQKDVRAVEMQLEEYATQSLKDISDYFLQLHSFLQNEEQRILEDFHGRCLQPQQTIRNAFSKLGESQNILNKMRCELEHYQLIVPNDIHLCNLFNIYNTQLEQIECSVQISKLTQNPFIFEVKYDLRKDFPKCFIYNYNDPEIGIRLASIYSDLNQTFRDTISVSSDEMDVDCYIEKHKRKNNERNKKKRQAQRRNDTENDPSHNDNTTDIDAQVSLPRDKELVRISYVKSPEHFFVQTKSAIHQIRELSNKYINFMQTDVIPKVIAEGQCYMTYHTDDKQWYRAMVKKTISEDLYKVFLVDIGMDIEMPKERFCEMDTKSLSIPFAAIRCAINDIMPAGKAWNEEANNLLIEIIGNHFVRISIIERIKENILSVDLISTAAEETISVRDSFLYTGLAREKSGATNMPSSLKKISPVARTNQRLPKYSFHNGDLLLVKVTHIENPLMFYAIKFDSIEAAQKLKADLNFKYANTKIALQPIFVAPPQMCCAVRIADVWHRARIEEIRGGGNICVQLVDEGSQREVHWRQIFPLINKFRTQKEFAIKCALADVEPLQQNNYDWTAEAIREFNQLVANPTLQMTIISTNQTVSRVTLHVCKKHMDINIGAMLAKYGHCLSTGDNSQVVEVVKSPKKRMSLPVNPLTDVMHLDANLKGNDMSLQGNPPQTVAAVNSNPVKILKRTPVKVIHLVDPGEFYIQIVSLATGIAKFHNQLQQSQNDEISGVSSFSLSSENSKKWCVGNHCLVYTKYKSKLTKNSNTSSSQSEWYRAIIISITTEIESEFYTVFLRDIGATISDITSDLLRVIDHQWDRVTNAVHRCHLACVEPTGGMSAWSHSAIDYFQHTVTSFESLSATLQGKRLPGTDSLPIVLWGTITETEDPLAPCISKHSIINRILVKAGLAHSVQRLDVTEQLERLIQIELAEGEITIEEWKKNFFAKSPLKEIDRCAQLNAVDLITANTDNSEKVDYQDYKRLPEFDFTLDIEVDSVACGELTISTTKAPEPWLQSKPIDKSIFAAIPTYVDYDAIVYLHDANDDDLLTEMRGKIMKIYGEYKLPIDFTPTYTPGQGCLVRYHVDKRLYRGIVQELRGENYIVQFIDYGNTELVKYQELYPFAPFPKLPRLSHKYRIEGIRAKSDNGVYTTDVLDIMHATIVEKLVSIRIEVSELEKSIKACSMRLGNMDVAEYLLNAGHVLRAKTKSEVIKYKAQQKEWKPLISTEITTDNDENIEDEKVLPDRKADKMFQFKHFKHNEGVTRDMDVFEDDENDENDDTVNDCLDQLIYNLDNDDINSNSDDSINDALNNALSPMQAAQAAQLAMKQHQQQTFVPPCKKRMFDSNEYKQLHKQMLYENLYGSENFMKSELEAMQSDNRSGDLGAAGWGIGDDDEDAAIVELEQSFALNYWHTTDDETDQQKAKEKEKEKEKTKEQQRVRGKAKGAEMEMRPRQTLETSAFEKFYPNETSSVFSHFSGIECFKNPQLPVGKRTFECSVVCVVTPTIVQILPHLTEFEYRELELQRRIKHLVKSAPQLTEFEPRTICLAVYYKDKKWYRALIRSHNPVAKQVDVLYVDYLNTASVATAHLKQCPLELISWPLRTIRARLHGLIPNQRLREKDIRQALQNIVLKRVLIARIAKEPKCLDGNDAISMSDFMDAEDVEAGAAGGAGGAGGGDVARQHGTDDIMEVDLYNADAQHLRDARVYETLIQDNFYSYKGS